MNTDPSGYLAAALDQYWNLDKSITNYDRFYGFSEGGGGGWGGNGGVLPGWAQNGFGFGGGSSGGFTSWRDFFGDVDDLYNSEHGGSSSGNGTKHYFESDWESFAVGYLYNEYHNSWSNTLASTRENAVNRFNTTMSSKAIASNAGEDLVAFGSHTGKNGKAEGLVDITDDFMFPGVSIIIHLKWPQGFFNPFSKTIHLPGDTETDFVVRRDYTRHEYGHYLQLQEMGLTKFF